MILLLPVDSSHTYKSFTVTLEKREYKFRFQWDDRLQTWYCSYGLPNRWFQQGVKLSVDKPMFTTVVDEDRLKTGFLYCKDISKQGIEPGLTDLGDRVIIMYITWDLLGDFTTDEESYSVV